MIFLSLLSLNKFVYKTIFVFYEIIENAEKGIRIRIRKNIRKTNILFFQQIS